MLEVARSLLGAVVARSTAEGTVTIRLTEVEAYAGELDPGSHAFRGRTPRTATMFGPPGHAYVYFTYGMHYCVNLVCGPTGTASAVLLRAGAVVVGLELAQSRRPAARPRDLARGPARLTKALNVDRALDGSDVTDPGSPLRVLGGDPVDEHSIRASPRTGVAGAGAATPWRFYLDAEPTVSPYRPAAARRGNRAGPVPDS